MGRRLPEPLLQGYVATPKSGGCGLDAGNPSGCGTGRSARVFFQLRGSDLRYLALVMTEHHCSYAVKINTEYDR